MRRRMTALLGLAGFMGLQATSWGQTFNWNNSSGGSFHTAGNWTPAGGPPDSQASAVFNIAGTYTTTFANNGGQSGSFDVRRGTVTFTAAVPTADHSWGFAKAGSQLNLVGPIGSDVATSSTLNLQNMPDFMAGELLSIGHSAGKTGTMNITNAGWLSTGYSIVGINGGVGNLNISTSLPTQESSLTAGQIRVGDGADSVGLVTVSGANARITSPSAIFGGDQGYGQLIVSNGALAQFDDASIGFNRTSDSTNVTVTGNNSRLLIDNSLTIGDGYRTTGILNVENGGLVTVGGTLSMGVASDTTLPEISYLNVTGVSSRLSAAFIYLGKETIGDATVVSGQLETNGLIMGSAAGSSGNLDVFGGSVTLNNAGVIVGDSGEGRLTLINGATLTTNFTDNVIGKDAGSRGVVTIEDSTWTTNAPIKVGRRGVGELYISDNSVVSATSLLIGGTDGLPNGNELGTLVISDGGRLNNSGVTILGFSNRDHSITVTNNGRLQTDAFVIGSNIYGPVGRGRLDISTGGQVLSNGGILTQALGTFATVSINGIGSHWNATGANSLGIGRDGTAVVNVTNGGALSAGNVSLGANATGIGTLNLTGQNSSASFSGTLGVGGTSTASGGFGTVHLNETTTLSVGGQVSLWSGGTINLNGGTFTAGSIAFNGGNWNWNEGTVLYSQPATLNNSLLNSLVGTAHTISPNRILGSTTGTALTVASNLTVDGGRLQSGGPLNVNAGTILMVNNGGEASSAGVVTNNGTILMNGPTSVMSGNTIDNRGSIRGSGVINNTLSNNTTGQVRVAQGDWLTFNGSGHANLGSVQLLGGVLEFANFLNTGTQGFISGHGTLIGSSASQGGLGHVNTGTFAFSGGNTNIYGDVQNNTTGRILTTGGTVTTFHDDVLHNGVEIRTSSGATTVFLGSVSGAGPFTGTGLVQFEGDLRPGNSPANVAFAGDVEFSVTARLVTELGGIIPGSEYDRLTVQGQVILNGQLDVQLINGFLPNAGRSFTIIDNLGSDSVLGTFAGLSEGSSFISGGQLWSITYQGGDGNNVMLMAVPEPGTWAMIAMTAFGGGVVYWRRRRTEMAS